jgi:cobyrinic acid a,c-diamide synthase
MILGGECGGTGKTVMCISLLGAWRACATPCAAFKKGPDYIDSAWLTAASGRACHNLDMFLMGEEVVARSFRDHAITTGVNLIEGNRGLFDGVDAEGSFSTAELAKLLACPVVLVLDCEKRTRTTAAAALGCRLLDPELHVAGVILNRLGTARQERVIRTAVERDAGLRVLGAVPRLPDLPYRERYLGLIPPQEQGSLEEAVAAATRLAQTYLDMEALRRVAWEAAPLVFGPDDAGRSDGSDRSDRSDKSDGSDGSDRSDKPRIGYFLDSAFHFYYPENLEALERAGARLTPIDAQRTPMLPTDLDGLYIGGGFPEQHASALSANATLLESVRAAADEGLPIYAECGGLMYLGRCVKTAEGEFAMAGVFPFSTLLETTPQGHGYVEAVVRGGHPFLAAGSRFRGHEFHYSRPVDWDERNTTFALSLSRGRGFSEGRDGLVYRNTFVTYVHIHALGEPLWAPSVVDLCKRIRRERRCAHTPADFNDLSRTRAVVSAAK